MENMAVTKYKPKKNGKTTAILTEESEQRLVVDYLEKRGLKFTAIPNSTFTRNWAVKMKNKKDGVRAGLPDLLIVLPKKLLFIEMKRTKGYTISPVQKSWIASLNGIGSPDVEAVICKGHVEAIEKIESDLKVK